MVKDHLILKRSPLIGIISRCFGLRNYGLEHESDMVTILGEVRRHVSYSHLSGPLKEEIFFGFVTIVLPIKNDINHKVFGLNGLKAKQFIEVVNNAFYQSILKKIESAWPEILEVFNAVSCLDSPQYYPSACLSNSILTKAKRVLRVLPSPIPKGMLTVEQKNILNSIIFFQKNPEQKRDAAIQLFVNKELSEMQVFFDEIESSPLTPEQRLAVVTDEDATLVLAGAGSGKTSVIVAKAAYLIEKKIRRPDEILLMAYAKDASTEMANRIKSRSGVTVDALTFHALGNKIIRDVSGKSANLVSHASDDIKLRDHLRDILMNDIAKREGLGSVIVEWFSEFYWPYKSEWDFSNQGEYYQWVESHDLRTLNGDLVKSYEEWEISNWLYCNGIEFKYEPTYNHDLPFDARGPYKPDFLLTESQIYIEHFGVRARRDSDGVVHLTTAPHIDQERYLDDMEWKRKVHQDNGTTLIETFSYERVEGRLLESLKEKLLPLVKFNPVSEDKIFDTLSKMGLVDGFTKTVMAFLKHFKGSGASIEQCRSRAEHIGDIYRNRAFLIIFQPLFEEYQRRLGAQIDFEDMINMATDHVESGRYLSPYRHLLVDEFQDISEGRSRLLLALKAQHSDTRIFSVGDDWQSIFRFSGSDINLMINFGEKFGGCFAGKNGVHATVDLGRTFRSVDKIALPARHFVLKNPSQINKKVVTATTSDDFSIKVTYFDRGQDDVALRSVLVKLSMIAAEGASVLLLGRYGRLRPKNMESLALEFPGLSIRFMTVHGSKGLEADHVVILRAVSGKMGFPSEMVDDPLLALVLPRPEEFEHAEERRLFYVALTRARKSVEILADKVKPSIFVRELVGDPVYETVQTERLGIPEHQCSVCRGRMLMQAGKDSSALYICEHQSLCGERLPSCNVCNEHLPSIIEERSGLFVCRCGAEFQSCSACSVGWLVERSGKYGSFLGCVRYPRCRGTITLR